MAKDYGNPVVATWHGVKNMFGKKEAAGILRKGDRVDGKTCLVTGANSGLGFAIATELASRGGHVIMACRSGIPEAAEAIQKRVPSAKVEMLPVDLSDISSIHRLCERLENEGVKLDIVICNAAIVPGRSRKTDQGFDEMFMVNYLAKFIIINRLLEQGSINTGAEELPRIIFVNSESHRSAPALDLSTFGEYQEYTMSKVVGLYGYYKLALITMARELSHRVNADNVKISVHSICPGAVNSRIARETPMIFKPLIRLVFTLFFQKPAKAALPVTYLCCSPDIEGQTDLYLHMWQQKPVDERADNEELGKKLWAKSEMLISMKTSGR